MTDMNETGPTPPATAEQLDLTGDIPVLMLDNSSVLRGALLPDALPWSVRSSRFSPRVLVNYVDFGDTINGPSVCVIDAPLRWYTSVIAGGYRPGMRIATGPDGGMLRTNVWPMTDDENAIAVALAPAAHDLTRVLGYLSAAMDVVRLPDAALIPNEKGVTGSA